MKPEELRDILVDNPDFVLWMLYGDDNQLRMVQRDSVGSHWCGFPCVVTKEADISTLRAEIRRDLMACLEKYVGKAVEKNLHQVVQGDLTDCVAKYFDYTVEVSCDEDVLYNERDKRFDPYQATLKLATVLSRAIKGYRRLTPEFKMTEHHVDAVKEALSRCGNTGG
jgi:hypothetical protein